MYIGGWFFLFHWIEIELGTIDRLAAWPISVSSYMDKITNEGNVFFFIFWEFRFRGFFRMTRTEKWACLNKLNFGSICSSCPGWIVKAQLYLIISDYLSNVAKSVETPKIGAKRFEFLSDFDERKLYPEKLLMLQVFQGLKFLWFWAWTMLNFAYDFT